MPQYATKDELGRASWKGEIRIDLVTFPVAAYNIQAPEAGGVRFHQLHDVCHSRIQYQKVCPIHGTVSPSEIVSGYEYEKDRYVEFDSEELAQLRNKEDKALTVDGFVEPEEIDPIYLDGRAYYLVPDGETAEEPYAVFRTAMERTDRWAIGEVVLAEREQLVLLRPVEGVLMMAVVRRPDEIREPEELGVQRLRSSPENVHLAEDLIEAATLPTFDLSGYEDRYRQRVMSVIRSKIEGHPMPAAAREEPSRHVEVSEALRMSLDLMHQGEPPRPREGEAGPPRHHPMIRPHHRRAS